jgi:transposase
MAGTRKTARTYGKSDSIDALAVARTALREPNLPRATHEPKLRELKLLVDHREDLVTERTAVISRLRWHLHELDPGLEPFSRTLNREPVSAASPSAWAAGCVWSFCVCAPNCVSA